MLLRVAMGHATRMLRKEQVMSMRKLSEKSGVSIGHISEFERGQKEMSSELLESLCKAFDIPTDDLLELATATIKTSNNK